MRALVVEDEFISRMVLESMLTSLFEVDSVENGYESLNAFERAHAEGRPYQVVFMDIMMPVLNGIDALEVIRRKETEGGLPQAMVIMTSALSDIKTVNRCMDSGMASAFFVKPLDKSELLDGLDKLGICSF